jgi:hypothetical protein
MFRASYGTPAEQHLRKVIACKRTSKLTAILPFVPFEFPTDSKLEVRGMSKEELPLTAETLAVLLLGHYEGLVQLKSVDDHPVNEEKNSPILRELAKTVHSPKEFSLIQLSEEMTIFDPVHREPEDCPVHQMLLTDDPTGKTTTLTIEYPTSSRQLTSFKLMGGRPAVQLNHPTNNRLRTLMEFMALHRPDRFVVQRQTVPVPLPSVELDF